MPVRMAACSRAATAAAAWRLANTGLGDAMINTLAIASPSTTLYAGTTRSLGNGIYKSTNGGASWALANSGLVNTGAIFALAVDPITPTIVYAGTGAGNGGMYKSMNGGDTWGEINTGLPGGIGTKSPRTLAIHPLAPSTLYLGTFGGGVYKTIDGGGSWITASVGLSNKVVYSLAIDPVTPGYRLCRHGGRRIPQPDGGANWGFAGSGLGGIVYSLAIHPTTPATLLAATSTGIYRTTTSGDSWEYLSGSLASTDSAPLRSTRRRPPRCMPGRRRGRVQEHGWRRRLGGRSRGLTATNIQSLAVDPLAPSLVYAGTTLRGVFKSGDAGGTWKAVNVGLNGLWNFVPCPGHRPGEPLHAVCRRLRRGGVQEHRPRRELAPANNGLTYTTVYALAIHPQNTSILYAGTTQGIFKSANGAESWSETGAQPAYKNLRALLIDPASPQTMLRGHGRRGRVQEHERRR